MELNLKGKNVIVTGGSRGLGKAIGAAFAAGGANVVLNYTANADAANAAAGEIAGKHGVKAIAIKADVADEASVAKLFDGAEGALGPVDILVNNAGVCPVTMIVDTTYDEWLNVMDINVNGIFLTCREFARRLIAQKRGGWITNITSQAAFNGSKRGKTHYSASKGAVVSFTISFAKEVAEHGIYVNAVAPGMMLTDMTRETLAGEGEMEKYGKQIPLGRLAGLDEIARAVLFMSSEASSYSTGSIFDATGGLMSR